MKVRFFIQPFEGETISLPIVANITITDLHEMVCDTLEPFSRAWNAVHEMSTRQYGKLLQDLFPRQYVPVDYINILDEITNHFGNE